MKKILKALILIPLMSCSSIADFGDSGTGADAQFTTKITARPIVAPLQGSTTKLFEIPQSLCTHYSWIALDPSQNFNFFQIEEVISNGRRKKPKSEGPKGVVENVSALPSMNPVSTTSTDPSIGKFQIAVSFNPTIAMEDENKPFEATLLAACAAPRTGTIKIHLYAFVQGIHQGDNNCGTSPSGMEALRYRPVDGMVDFYMCSREAVTGNGQDNSVDHPDTNFSQIPLDKEFIFYKQSEESLCLFGARDPQASNPEPEPSIPNFSIVIPQDVKDASPIEIPINDIPVKLPAGWSSGGTLNAGEFLYEKIDLDLLFPFSLSEFTNGTSTPTSAECSNFGELAGEGSLGGDNISVVAWGVVGFDSLIEQFGIVDAVVAIKMQMVKQ